MLGLCHTLPSKLSSCLPSHSGGLSFHNLPLANANIPAFFWAPSPHPWRPQPVQTKPSSPPSAADSQTAISSQTSGLNCRQTVHTAEAVSVACDRDLNPAEQVKGLFCLMEKSGGEVQLLPSKNVINGQAPLSFYPILPQPVTVILLVTQWLLRSSHSLCILSGRKHTKTQAAETIANAGTCTELSPEAIPSDRHSHLFSQNGATKPSLTAREAGRANWFKPAFCSSDRNQGEWLLAKQPVASTTTS